jgi:hypothetical protein
LWAWTARHPEWHPGGFGDEVLSYAVRDGETLLLVDPLVTDGGDEVAALAKGVKRVEILITIGYHVRSAEPLAGRFGRRARIWGPKNCGSRLEDPSGLRVLEPGAEGPSGVRCFAIGRPARTERPLWLPSHRAVVFGDALVTTPDGELRMWVQEPVDDGRRRFYRERFAPTLGPLVGLEPQRILTTHGEPVLRAGAKRLREALDADPWYHRG